MVKRLMLYEASDTYIWGLKNTRTGKGILTLAVGNNKKFEK